MDEITAWNTFVQQSLLKERAAEEEVMLEITCPLSADQDTFRVGITMKGLRSRKWILLSSGLAVWSRHELRTCAQHMESILAIADELVTPERVRRDSL